MAYMKYGDLSAKFFEWKQKHNFLNDFDVTTKFLFIINAGAMEQWKHELDDVREHLSDDEYRIYQEMFQVGKTLLGVLVADTTDEPTATIFQLTEYQHTFSFPKILTGFTGNILHRSKLTRDVTLPTGKPLKLPYLVKPGSIYTGNHYDAPVFDCMDSRSDKVGKIAGQGFEYYIRDHNMYHDNSLLGTINYQTGITHFVRYNAFNEAAMIKNYEALKAAAAASSSSSSSSGKTGSGGSSGKTSTSTGIPYKYITLEGTVVGYGEPIDLIFSVNLETEEITDNFVYYGEEVNNAVTEGTDSFDNEQEPNEKSLPTVSTDTSVTDSTDTSGDGGE